MIADQPTSPDNRPLKPAVFLDRDGTLIEDVGHLASPEDIQWYPDTVDALTALSRHFLLFVVSNQSGVALGELTMEQVTRVNDHIHRQLEESGIVIQKWYVCPHTRDENCRCIKPKPYFLNEAVREFGVNLATSYAIGDHPHDVTFATDAGAIGLYVLTGHGAKHRHQLPPEVPVYPTLMDAVNRIVGPR